MIHGLDGPAQTRTQELTKRTTRQDKWIAAACLATSTIALSACSGYSDNRVAESRPNILVIVADDLGYSDLGAFGGEIATPNLDALAGQGRVLSNFHTSASCSPTRAMLLSGADHHLVGLGQMGEVTATLSALGSNPRLSPQVSDAVSPFGASNGNTVNFGSVPDGYSGYLSNKALSMPEMLRDAGYVTYMAGKWHLAYELKANSGAPFWQIRNDALPKAKGFQRSFVLVDGGAAHFAPTLGKLTPQDQVTYAQDDVTMPSTALPRDFFSTRYYTDKLIEYIGPRHSQRKPFFAYAAYTAPHWPLQAPQADIDAQAGKYDEGYEVIRARRIAKMKEIGLLPPDFAVNPGLKSVAEGGAGKKHWSELTASEKAKQARLMEVYAAMVTNLDANVGRLVQHLKDIGEYDNTLILFMSDNGPEGVHFLAGSDNVDNSLSNIGRPSSMVEYGERWAEVSATPFRLWKANTGAEGSTSVPAIVKMPGQHAQLPMITALTHVTDVLPTVLDLVGIKDPGASYQGRSIYPMSGTSLSKALTGGNAAIPVRTDDAVLADELFFNSYVIKSKWKLSRNADVADSTNPKFPGSPYIPMAKLPWKLFDLSKDRGETQDVAAANPLVVADLLKDWKKYAARNNVLMLNNTFTLPRDPGAP